MKSKTSNSYTLHDDIVGLDLGKSTTGVARMNIQARIAEPLPPVSMSDSFIKDIALVLDEYGASALVVGLPRSLQGTETEQTAWSRTMVEQLRTNLDVPVFAIDEAGTTKAAEVRAHTDQSVDSVAAGILLEDFASEVIRGNIDNVSF